MVACCAAARRQLRGARPTQIGMAIAGLKERAADDLPEAVRFFERVGYHPYEGITEDFGERERLIAHLGQNRAMILHNHGVLTVGKTAREAFILMRHLLDAAEIQLAMEATGGDLIEFRPTSAARPWRNTRSTTAAAAPPTGRPICACSTASIPAIGRRASPVQASFFSDAASAPMDVVNART
jgi:rhamnose utilization protein RhaD (predicted bifunctional aldolase and dehydrogenase)